MFQVLSKESPEPTTELEYQTPFELLVSVILSAQATDVSVNRATQTLYAVANTPTAIRKLGLKKLKGHIKRIGLYNTKAKNIIETCKILESRYDGKVPSERQHLESLPGVGRKTANVVLNTAFDQPTIAVDTHIFRIGNRTGLAPGKTPLAVEKKLLKAIPAHFKLHAHHWLILHGRYICKARKPDCPDCAVADLCRFKGKTTASS